MPYGRRKYGRLNKPIEQPAEVVVDNSSIPTFVCPHCGLIKAINTPYVELSALENGKIFIYTKMCGSCAELLKAWLRK
jgi:hypothetical protein